MANFANLQTYLNLEFLANRNSSTSSYPVSELDRQSSMAF